MNIKTFITVGEFIQLIDDDQNLIIITDNNITLFNTFLIYRKNPYKLMDEIPTNLQNKYVVRIKSDEFHGLIITIND